VLAQGSASVAFIGGNGSNVVPAAGAATTSFSGAAVAASDITPAVGVSSTDFGGSTLIAADMVPAAGAASVDFTGQAVEPGSCDPAEIWQHVLPNGKTAQATLLEMHAMVSELYKIHGLLPGAPLVVTQTQRTAGDIEQTVTQVDEGTVQVERVS